MATRATRAPGLSSPSQVPEVARAAAAAAARPPCSPPSPAAARPLYFIRCSGDDRSRRLLEYTYRVGGCRPARGARDARSPRGAGARGSARPGPGRRHRASPAGTVSHVGDDRAPRLSFHTLADSARTQISYLHWSSNSQRQI